MDGSAYTPALNCRSGRITVNPEVNSVLLDFAQNADYLPFDDLVRRTERSTTSRTGSQAENRLLT